MGTDICRHALNCGAEIPNSRLQSASRSPSACARPIHSRTRSRSFGSNLRFCPGVIRGMRRRICFAWSSIVISVRKHAAINFTRRATARPYVRSRTRDVPAVPNLIGSGSYDPDPITPTVLSKDIPDTSKDIHDGRLMRLRLHAPTSAPAHVARDSWTQLGRRVSVQSLTTSAVSRILAP